MDAQAAPRRTVIMGAAGRDFHNFDNFFRDDDAVADATGTGNVTDGCLAWEGP